MYISFFQYESSLERSRYMSKSYVIGLDIGTTSAKAVLFTTTGNVVAESEETYSLYNPSPSWSEQNPYEVEIAARNALNNVLDKSSIHSDLILAIGISSAMHSLICLDEMGEPLSPSIIWADGRSVTQAQKIKESCPQIYLNTGTPIHPMSPLSKLVWMSENNYRPYLEATHFISIKEFITIKWFGEHKVDYSVASATGLLNLRTRKWDEYALSLAGISESQLSIPVPPTYILHGMTPLALQELSRFKEIPFIIGASDGPLANLGIGAIETGDTAITIGTSGAIRQMTKAPKLDELQELFCYAFTEDLYIMGGPTNNGAIVLQWLKEVFGEVETQMAKLQDTDAYDLLTNLAAEANAGSNGLLFLPYINGERAPHWDSNARGTYIGLTNAHQKKHLIRAGLEGVIFSLFNVAESLQRLGGKSNNLYASGGFSRSSLWLQILADIFDQDVEVPKSHQSSAWGAAWMALFSIGEVSSLSDIKNYIPMQKKLHPAPQHKQIYQRMYGVFREMYPDLKRHFQQLSSIQKLD
jgi:gluconokinase